MAREKRVVPKQVHEIIHKRGFTLGAYSGGGLCLTRTLEREDLEKYPRLKELYSHRVGRPVDFGQPIRWNLVMQFRHTSSTMGEWAEAILRFCLTGKIPGEHSEERLQRLESDNQKLHRQIGLLMAGLEAKGESVDGLLEAGVEAEQEKAKQGRRKRKTLVAAKAEEEEAEKPVDPEEAGGSFEKPGE